MSEATSADIEAELLRRSLARANLQEFTKHCYLNYVESRHTRILCEHLQQVEEYIRTGGERGINRLLINLPPRHSKSLHVSEHFPAWFLGRNPDKRVVLTSYGAELSEGWSLKVRQLIESDKFQTLFGPKSSWETPVEIDPEARKIQKWELKNNTGGLNAVGVGGALTGFGAHCVVGSTKIMTEDGEVRIDDLYMRGDTCKILSYDEKNKKAEWKKPQAFSSSQGSGIYRITTEGGRVVETTSDHRFFTGEEYTEAAKLTPGDNLVSLLQERQDKTCLRISKGIKAGAQRFLLQLPVFNGSPFYKEPQTLRRLWRAFCHQTGQILPSLPQKEICEGANSKNKKEAKMPRVPDFFPAVRLPEQSSNPILLSPLCECGSFQENVWRRKLSLFSWSKLWKGLFRSKKRGYGEGQPPVSGMWQQRGNDNHCFWSNKDYNCCSSQGRRQTKQRPGQPNSCLCDLPCDSPQVISDTVASVECVREGETVYDIQVEDNHNFFANGILVHNCLIIDDPLKDREEADSETMRKKVWEWYTGVARTRLMKGGAIVVCATRWHEDDLPGRLLESQGDRWTHLNFPALAEEDDVLLRKEGQPLWPEMFDKETLEEIRTDVGPRDWGALYQQRPTSASGEVFKDEWFVYGPMPNREDITRCYQVWDTAFTEKSEGDYSVGVTVFVTRDGLYIADIMRGRFGFPELKRKMIQFHTVWNDIYRVSRIYIENKGSGQSAIQSLKKDTALPIIPINIEKDWGKSKLQRANAAAGYIESGRVYFKENAMWLDEMKKELLGFPRSRFDDITDAVTWAILMTQGGGKAPRSNPKRSMGRGPLSRHERIMGLEWGL